MCVCEAAGRLVCVCFSRKVTIARHHSSCAGRRCVGGPPLWPPPGSGLEGRVSGHRGVHRLRWTPAPDGSSEV